MLTKMITLVICPLFDPFVIYFLCIYDTTLLFLILNEQATSAVTSVPVTSMTRHFPASVLLQEQRDEYKPFLHIFKEDKTSQVRLSFSTSTFVDNDLPW